MNSELDLRLKGFHRTFRGKFLLVQRKVLSNSEYILWDLSFSVLADWDKNHPTKYGTFEYTQDEIAYFLGCDNTSVSKNSRNLYKLGLWKKRGDGRIIVCGFDIVENLATVTKADGIVDIQSYIGKTQNYFEDTQQIIEKAQPVLSKGISTHQAQNFENLQHFTPKDSLVSSKVSFSLVIKDRKEYQRIKERVDELGVQLKDKFLDEDAETKKLVDEHQRLAESMLMYEIENDMLPI